MQHILRTAEEGGFQILYKGAGQTDQTESAEI